RVVAAGERGRLVHVEGEGLGGVAADPVVRREVQRVGTAATGDRRAAQHPGGGVEADAAGQGVAGALAGERGGAGGGEHRQAAGRRRGEGGAGGAGDGRGLVHGQGEGLVGIRADAVVAGEVERVGAAAARRRRPAQHPGGGVEGEAAGQDV